MIRKQNILPVGHRNRPGHPMQPKGLLFHTTNNWRDGAGDEMHGEYMENVTDRVVSWHHTVDKDSATQHIPEDENAWHAGDGTNGYYNRNYIGMEIACEAVELGEQIDAATYRNAVQLAAEICIHHGFGYDQLQPHRVVYGKDCPHHTLMDAVTFKNAVMDRIAEMNKPPQVVPQQEVSEWAVDAREWVMQTGISDGTRPKDPVTREEVWTMLYRMNNQ